MRRKDGEEPRPSSRTATRGTVRADDDSHREILSFSLLFLDFVNLCRLEVGVEVRWHKVGTRRTNSNLCGVLVVGSYREPSAKTDLYITRSN